MDLKIRLQGLREEVLKEVYLDIMLSGMAKAPEFKFIREMHYREEFTSVDRFQETANGREFLTVVHLTDELKLWGLRQAREHDVQVDLLGHLTPPTVTAHSASRNTHTLWEQRNRMFHGQSRKRGPHPKPPSRTQQQNARSRVLKIVKFTSLFRALPFPLDGSESIRNRCSSTRRTARSRLV